jgi:hypothetical protein
MVVHTQNRHPGHAGMVGLHIGEINVRQYFPLDVETVELELDHLCIVCPLEPSFWQGQPEIHDSRLSSWLESKRSTGKLSAQPAPVALIPSGEHSFRLQLLARDESDHALTNPLNGVVTAQMPSSLAAIVPSLNKRKYDAGHSPDRRRVGRLKSDERSSSSANH